VIELLTTVRGDDSTGIMLEYEIVSLNGNRDWVLVKSSLQLGWRVGSHISIILNRARALSLVVRASPLDSFVWVCSLKLQWGSLDVSEGVVHKTTIATHVSSGSSAVNELLLGEILKVVVFDGPDSFDRACGGESPA